MISCGVELLSLDLTVLGIEKPMFFKPNMYDQYTQISQTTSK